MPYKFGYVPPPQPDETIYSFLAAQQRLLPDRPLIKKLFGGSKIHVRPDWPIGLRVLAAALPCGLQINAQQLLNEHTLVPLFLPLLEESRQKKLLSATLGIDAGHPWLLAGAPNHTTRELRACPTCFDNDQRQGRAYWHRIHQCHGVLTCPQHPDVILQSTLVTRHQIAQDKRFYDLDEAQPLFTETVPLSKSDLKRAVQISTGIDLLLANSSINTNVVKIRLELRKRALKTKYATAAPGKINALKLTNDLSKWLGVPLACMLGLSESADNKFYWAYRFLTGGRDSISPLKYTLLALFLESDPDELAHASSNLTIPPVIPRTRKFGGIPRSYLRFQRNRSKLKKLWNTPALSVNEIARRLAISSLTVRRWAVRLNLEFPRKGEYPVKRPIPRHTLDPFEDRLKTKRAQWIRSTKSLRGGTVSNTKTNGLYLWLSRYDVGWLRRNWPKHHKIEKINWKHRDRLLAAQLTHAAEHLLNKKRPCWLSKTRLIHETGYNGFWHHNHRIRLPKSTKLLATISETRAAFTKRRLQYLP